MHPFVQQPLAIRAAARETSTDRGRDDVNDLLFAVDPVITDYSSFVFEYSTLGRPMLFFAYDLGGTSPRAISTCRSSRSSRAGSCGRSRSCSMRWRGDYEGGKVAAFATRHFAHSTGIDRPGHRRLIALVNSLV